MAGDALQYLAALSLRLLGYSDLEWDTERIGRHVLLLIVVGRRCFEEGLVAGLGSS